MVDMALDWSPHKTKAGLEAESAVLETPTLKGPGGQWSGMCPCHFAFQFCNSGPDSRADTKSGLGAAVRGLTSWSGILQRKEHPGMERQSLGEAACANGKHGLLAVILFRSWAWPQFLYWFTPDCLFLNIYLRVAGLKLSPTLVIISSVTQLCLEPLTYPAVLFTTVLAACCFQAGLCAPSPADNRLSWPHFQMSPSRDFLCVLQKIDPNSPQTGQ